MGDKLFSNAQGLWPKPAMEGTKLAHILYRSQNRLFLLLLLFVFRYKSQKRWGRAKLSTKIVHSSEVERYKNFPFSLVFLRDGLKD